MTLKILTAIILLSPSLLAAGPLEDATARHPGKTGAYVLEKGREALLLRAWLGGQARKTIDVQYFIWSADNIGILAAEGLLRAAERGVRVRILVDDLLVDAEYDSLLALATQPGVEIRVYNPSINVGTSLPRRLANLLAGFRRVNQRMHNKTFIVDGAAGITGGRNMADEYFDFDHAYNFRDRDILLLGPAAGQMQASFEKFWNSAQAVPVQALLKEELAALTPEKTAGVRRDLHLYAENPENLDPEHRGLMADFPARARELLGRLVWGEADFVSDEPGKNAGDSGLKGGGLSTEALAAEVRRAKKRVVIHTPYLVLSEFGRALFGDAVRRGVSVEIVTNSLESTDNLMAYSGYAAAKRELLGLGLKIYEYKPYPEAAAELLEKNYAGARRPPIFALHAKTMVIDGETLFVGTFNLDPRSANLNTEGGVLVRDRALAAQVEKQIEADMLPGNSWDAGRERGLRRGAGLGKRLKLWLFRFLPLEPIL